MKYKRNNIKKLNNYCKKSIIFLNMGDTSSRILSIGIAVFLIIYGFYVFFYKNKENSQDWSDDDTDFNDYEEDSELTNKTKGQVKKYQ